MSAPIIIELAGEPVGKGRPRFSRKNGIAFTPEKTRSYEDALRYAAQVAMGTRPPLDGPLDVHVEARFPVPASWSRKKREQALAGEILPVKRPDWDNLGKVTDALNQIVFVDDAQIVDGRVSKRYHERPALIVYVREYSNPVIRHVMHADFCGWHEHGRDADCRCGAIVIPSVTVAAE